MFFNNLSRAYRNDPPETVSNATMQKKTAKDLSGALLVFKRNLFLVTGFPKRLSQHRIGNLWHEKFCLRETYL